jgi:hypothetical protein
MRMNYLQVVQVIVCTPHCQDSIGVNLLGFVVGVPSYLAPSNTHATRHLFFEHAKKMRLRPALAPLKK